MQLQKEQRTFQLYDRSKEAEVKARPIEGANHLLARKLLDQAVISEEKTLKALAKV